MTDAQDIFDELQIQAVERDASSPEEQNTDDSPASTEETSSTRTLPARLSEDLSGDGSPENTLTATEVFESILDGLFDNNDGTDNNSNIANRSNVISDFFASQSEDLGINPNDRFKGDVFDDSINLAALFSAMNGYDNEGFSTLSREISKQQDNIDSQISGARALVGSTFTVSSGLSVGYVLYLLRGGAILSSVLSSLPAWRFVDPLPVLGTLGGSLDSDGESLQSITGSE